MRATAGSRQRQDRKVPDTVGGACICLGSLGSKQLKGFEQEVACSKWYWGKIKMANIIKHLCAGKNMKGILS